MCVCATTIAVTIKFDKQNTINIVCAWVDFAGAFLIGILAFSQAKKFKKHDQMQFKKENESTKRQNDFEVFKQIAEMRKNNAITSVFKNEQNFEHH